jgi:hypothetical protein
MAKITWIGDSDPNAQSISQFGYHFVKGEPVDVRDKKVAGKLATNPLFSTDKVEAAEADEPDAADLAARAEEGTEKAALKAQLRELGVAVQGNPSVDTLRSKLAEKLAS